MSEGKVEYATDYKPLHDGSLKLARGHRIQFEQVQGCDVLLYPEGVVQLSESAAMILKQVDGQRTVIDIAAELNRMFPEDGDLTADVRSFLEVAHARGWIA
ncbi:pyrroloquinoline quinone biosynthesis peptide chaperone PqqD [uncultured Nevskia sp.]|uniref:pyrroloquinoline quinone biosynthesis peptide chaperone PqqD n=1 Tax=uncultured Nevskia sp. TaxID=228950 RepID=UPI0025FC4D3D|nr:pyrroloquinoline quinone biosynthesis peptide chaperone PqqD [uncultured Nevskia sp.]